MLLPLAKSAVYTQKMCMLSIRMHTFFGRATAEKIVIVASAGNHENASKRDFKNLAFPVQKL